MRLPSPPRRVTSLVLALALGLIALPALAAATDDPAICDQPLAVLAPTGSTGNLDAVAVTAQVLEQGVDGWAHVSWETFEGTTLTSVTVVRADGEEVLTEDLERGSATAVLALVACGSVEAGR